MNLLGARLYDPAAAVTKATSALLAMTALDTTNLRIAFTIPAHGMVRVRLVGRIHGATTFPSVLLGVLNGAAVVARVAPMQTLGNTAVATAMVNIEADFIVSGLTPGAVNWDAAYGVETIIAATGIKYGGPNNTTANDAFGGFCFELWDPRPVPVNFALLSIDANGRLDVIKVAGTTQTARDLGAQLDAAVSTRSTYAGGAVASVTGAVGSVVGLTAANLDVAVSSRSTYAGADTAGTTTLLGRLTAPRAGLLDNLDATISSRFASASYIVPPTVIAIRSEMDANSTKLAHLDADVSTRLAAVSYTAPDNAMIAAIAGFVDTEISAIKAKTDNLPTVPAAVGSAMTLTTGERTAVANEVEAQIIDEADPEKVLIAITDKIASANPSLGGLTLGAIASQVRTELTVELGRIDAAVSSVAGGGGDSAGVTTLLARLTNGRAGNLDRIDANVSSRSTYDSNKLGYCWARWRVPPPPS